MNYLYAIKEKNYMKRNFNEWLKTFKSSICDYGYYVDFEKVYGNIENIKVELNILNSLIGSKNIEHDFNKLINRLSASVEVYSHFTCRSRP